MRGEAGNPSGGGCRPDAGSTLIEVLVALVVSAGAVFVLVGGMSALFTNAFQTRQSTTAAVVTRDYAEALEVAVAQSSAAATAAGTTAWCQTTYTVAYVAPSGYTPTNVGVCPATIPVSTPQFEPVVISVAEPNSSTEQLKIVVRKT